MMHSVRMPAIELLPAEVIKAFAQGLNAAKALLGGWPEIRLPSSETANVVVLMAEEDSLDRDLIVRGALETTLSVDGNRRRYGAILGSAATRKVAYAQAAVDVPRPQPRQRPRGPRLDRPPRPPRLARGAPEDARLRPEVRTRGRVREAAGGLGLRAPLQDRQERDRERELARVRG